MRVIASGFLLLLLCPVIVAAQQNSGGSDLSPLRVLETTVTTGSEYTDNFFRSESKPQSNFRQTITPSVALKLDGPFRANLSYSPTVTYSTLVEELAHFHSLDGAGEYDVTPFLTVRAGDKFSRSDNPAITDPNTLQVRRTTTTQNLATIGAPYRTESWSVTPRGSWTVIDNESEIRLADERSSILTLGGEGAVTLLPFNTTLGASAEATRGQFRLSDDFSGQTYRGGVSRQLGPRLALTLDGSVALRQPDRGEDFTIRDVALGGRYEVWETYALSGRIGYQQTDVARQSGTQGLTYSVQASYTGASVTVATASELSFQETFAQAENVGVLRSQTSGATLTYRARDDLVLTGMGRWSRNEFLESRVDQTDTVLSWGVSINYQLTRTMTLSAAWDRTNRDSTRAGNSFSANTFRLDLSVALR